MFLPPIFSFWCSFKWSKGQLNAKLRSNSAPCPCFSASRQIVCHLTWEKYKFETVVASYFNKCYSLYSVVSSHTIGLSSFPDCDVAAPFKRFGDDAKTRRLEKWAVILKSWLHNACVFARDAEKLITVAKWTNDNGIFSNTSVHCLFWGFLFFFSHVRAFRFLFLSRLTIILFFH